MEQTAGTATAADELARGLLDEGVEALFGVMGHGNLRLIARLAPTSVRYYAARHEANAVLMADGYARASGRVGVCTVTQGPGLTNTLTALVTARRARSPIVILAGEASEGLQAIDQDRVFAAAGVPSQRLVDPNSVREVIGAAFDRAHRERTPVGVNMPVAIADAAVSASRQSIGAAAAEGASPPAPSADAIECAVDAIVASRRPVVLAGRGAVAAGARDAVEELSTRIGALVATTLPAKGFFSGNPRSLGISGGFSSRLAREFLSEADCLITFGAALSSHTLDAGELYGEDLSVVRCDVDPEVLVSAPPRVIPVLGDARQAAEALVVAIERRAATPAGWRDTDAELRLSTWTPEDEIDERSGLEGLDPRTLMLALEQALPRERVLVASGGHCQGWPCMYLSVPDARSFIHPQEFGSIACGLGEALGAAVARPDRLVVCVTGDGDLMMSLADIDSAVRFGVRLVVVVLNDSAFGGEIHALGDLGLDAAPARFPTSSFASIADAVGGHGMTVRTLDDVAAVADRVASLQGLLVADCRIDPQLRAEWDRRNHARYLLKAAAA